MPKIKEEKLIGVIIIVLDKTGTKFLGGVRKGGYMPGTIGIPGGRIRFNEKLEQACVRELKEETDLVAQKIEYVGVVRQNQKESIFLDFLFACKEYVGKVNNLEPEKCEGWEWFDLDNLPDNILRGHKAGIEMYLKGEKLRDLV